MRRVLLALAAVLTLAGCASTHTNPNKPVKVTLPTGKPGLRFREPNGTTCVTRNPPQANECAEQAMKAEGKLGLTVPTRVDRAPCGDYSQWQGYYPDFVGLRCVILQAAYGNAEEPSLHEQIRDAVQHGIPYGVYDFAEPGVSGGSELRVIRSLAPHAPLGYWDDVEVSGVFWRSCEFTSEARAQGLPIFGVFSYPGGYAAGGGTYCPGAKLWPSEWGVSGPAPFGGFPASSIVLWQDCGGCFRGADHDENEGLIELSKPVPPPKPKPKPKPTRRQLERQLASDIKLRTILRALEARHNCRNPPYHRPLPDTAAYRHACYGVWVPQGRSTDGQIATISKELHA